MQKDQQMMLQNINDFVHIDDGFGSVFVPDSIDVYCVLSCDYYQLCDSYIALGLGVSCLLTPYINKCNVILNNALFSLTF
jgi:hypothetical protein